MRHLKNLSFFVLFLIFNYINSAPTTETKSLYNVLKSDKRFEKLFKEKFVRECESNQLICTALIDVTLRFNEAHIDFAANETHHDEDFCESNFLKIIPDTPTVAETSTLMKSFNLTWFKDILKHNDGKMCSEQCMYKSFEDYSSKAKPVCFFIYDQYKLLASRIDSNKNNNNTVEKNESISVEHSKVNDSSAQLTAKENIISEVGTLVDVVAAKKPVVMQNVTVNKTESTGEQVHVEEQAKTTSNETKKVDELPAQVTSPAAVTQAGKTETAQVKTDTKTANINLDDEQSSLADNPVFDENPGTDKDVETNLDVDVGVNGDDDDDDMYSVDFQLRDNNQNSNKYQQEQLTDIEPHDSDNPQRVQSAPFEEDPDSNFFTYLCIIMFLTIVLYILYHNRHKILALLLEGRQGRNSRRGRSRGGSKAAYSKLDCNLEEAITSKKSLSGKSLDIIY
ncbi:uncharacterized protein [Chironomus tepperi]|uniref:uncharacterized protein n=1 Tax=Chironomus tepperi TaxID=113505 RepID=UPI00391F9CEB